MDLKHAVEVEEILKPAETEALRQRQNTGVSCLVCFVLFLVKTSENTLTKMHLLDTQD